MCHCRDERDNRRCPDRAERRDSRMPFFNRRIDKERDLLLDFFIRYLRISARSCHMYQ
jgi:hypothetical protein